MQLREQWAPHVAAGHVRCHLCGRPIMPGQSWDLDHLIPLALGGDVDGPTHPAHSSCNRSRGAAMGNRRRLRFSVRGGEDRPFLRVPPLNNLRETGQNAGSPAVRVSIFGKDSGS